MMREYEEVLDPRGKLTTQQKEIDRLLQEKEESKIRAVEDLANYYEAKLREKSSQIDQLLEGRKKSLQVLEEAQKEIAEETDRKIRKLKNKHKMRLREEKKEKMNLLGERGFLKKQLTILQQEIDEQKEEIEESRLENTNHTHVIRSFEKEIVVLKDEIKERKETILDKEIINVALKKQNQELTNFQFVLENKILEVQNLLEPRDNDIRKKNDKIYEMENELEIVNKQNIDLKLHVEELKRTLNAKDKELHGADNVNIMEMENELEMVNKQNIDLKLHVEELKRTLNAKDKELHGADNVKIMEENTSLNKEIDDLRRELKIARSHIHDLEVSMRIKRKKNKRSVKSVITSAEAVTEKEFKENEKNTNTIERQSLQTSDLDPGFRLPSSFHLPSVNQAASRLVATSPRAVNENQAKDKTEIVNIIKIRSLPGLKYGSGSALGLPPIKQAASKN